MNDETAMRRQLMSSQTSRLSSYSGRHFDFLDTHHSVFSRNSYYNDKLAMHPWLRRPYSRYSGISLSTLCAGPCSNRIDELARPRIKRERLIRQEFFDNFTNYAYSGVKAGALTAQCSERLTELARPKKKPVNSMNGEKTPHEVPQSALQAHITDRIEALAKPRYNKHIHMQSLRNNKKPS
ncbi:unnamed protein product [Rotaria magnacalcarata]|uniref:Uncharacterized protein n=4 Tax=Rotaria magnacalcarata TaxID=392030 RepID=A0A816KHT3_9BILA|nr:unnamed protein product [Rotaria magnacalcarata]CAF1318850.1 unnamed protein product [Rotaria magnacalcarata]CAF1921997.1 unnamed protein product [Rotaria magnacalcarata]CAF1933154.1 unnamed protein product [Rotaria magnacalcarata]CAF1937998.1 unnamed protein product [Rotaria magnacalcarata]